MWHFVRNQVLYILVIHWEYEMKVMFKLSFQIEIFVKT